MRILIAGDTHGEKNHVNYLHQIAQNENITTIVQVGDFGYGWPEREPFIDYVSEKAQRFGFNWYWLDGNHENFDALEAEGVAIMAPEPQLMRPNVWFLGRGCRWEWDGKQFMAMGGAYSIDEDGRTPGVSWWAQETITEAQALYAARDGVVDVLLTHDAPEGACPIVGTATFGYKADAKSRRNRELLTQVIDAVLPTLVIHGHMHHRYNSGGVIGLGRDGQRRDSWVILDVPTLTIENQS